MAESAHDDIVESDIEESAENVISTLHPVEKSDIPSEDVKTPQGEMQKQRVPNERSRQFCEGKGTVESILPHYLLTILHSIVDDLITQLQTSCTNNEVDNRALNRALEILKVVQQSLHGWIHHEMSTEEQLSLAHKLSKSMVGHGRSLEELQSSPEVVEIVNLLLGLNHNPQSGSEKALSRDVFSFVVSAYTSMISDDRVSLHSSVLMDVLGTVGTAVREDIPLTNCLEIYPLNLLMEKGALGGSDSNSHVCPSPARVPVSGRLSQQESKRDKSAARLLQSKAESSSYGGFLGSLLESEADNIQLELLHLLQSKAETISQLEFLRRFFESKVQTLSHGTFSRSQFLQSKAETISHTAVYNQFAKNTLLKEEFFHPKCYIYTININIETQEHNPATTTNLTSEKRSDMIIPKIPGMGTIIINPTSINSKIQQQMDFDIHAQFTTVTQVYAHTNQALSNGKQGTTESDEDEQQTIPLKLEWQGKTSVDDSVHLKSYGYTNPSKLFYLPPIYYESNQESELAVEDDEIPAGGGECLIGTQTTDIDNHSGHAYSTSSSGIDEWELGTPASEEEETADDVAYKTASEAHPLQKPATLQLQYPVDVSPDEVMLQANTLESPIDEQIFTSGKSASDLPPLPTSKVVTEPLASVATQEYSPSAGDQSKSVSSDSQIPEHSCAASEDIILPEPIPSEFVTDTSSKPGIIPSCVHIETVSQESGSTSHVSPMVFISSAGACITHMGKAVYEPSLPVLPDHAVMQTSLSSEEASLSESTHIHQEKQLFSSKNDDSMSSEEYHPEFKEITTQSKPQECTETETPASCHVTVSCNSITQMGNNVALAVYTPSPPGNAAIPISKAEDSFLTTPQQCTETHTNNIMEQVVPNNLHLLYQPFVQYYDSILSTFEESIVVCLYFHQGNIRITLNKIQPILDFFIDDETDSTDYICEELGQKLSEMRTDCVQEVVVVIDIKANLLVPSLVSNLQAKWIDHFQFRMILYPPEINEPGRPFVVQLPQGASCCVVGDPRIPPCSTVNGINMSYPNLPGATKEAEWVSYLLKCPPILHENATKAAVVKEMQCAKLIHIATHRSGDEGYLAFAGTFSHGKFSISDVFLTPNDIKELAFQETPALVVLSSCASARMKFGEEGIDGVTSAFLLAGAQAVISTFTSISDEPSLVFMKFFYQYLIVDRMMGMVALHKAMLSVRCFPEYSHPRHWSCYQYSGKEIQFINQSSSDQLCSQLGHSSVFPRVECLKQLECALLNSSTLSTSVPVLHGPPGVKPSEPLIDFIHCHHFHFTGGIFWINCRTPGSRDASIKEILATDEHSVYNTFNTCPSLVVIDSPCQGFLNEHLQNLLMKTNIHIVIITNNLDSLPNYITCQLHRDVTPIAVCPLSTEHAMMRLVHSAVGHHDKIPDELKTLIAACRDGDPEKVDVLCVVLKAYIAKTEQQMAGMKNTVNSIKDCVILNSLTFIELKVLTHLLVDLILNKGNISIEQGFQLIDSVKGNSDIISMDIFNSLRARRLLLPYPETIIYHPEVADGQMDQPNQVYMPIFLRTILLDQLLREEHCLNGHT